MTQRPFSRPGAIDLSVLKRPAGAPAPGGPGAPGAPGAAAAPGGGAGGAAGAAAGGGTAGGPAGAPSPYATLVDEQSFQAVLEASRTAAVLLVFFSRSRMPESGQLADDVAALSAEFEGRFLVGLVDIDATPQIAQAMQIPSIPLVVAVLDGRPMPLFQDVLPLEELRAALTQVVQQLAAQGITQRHQPLAAAPGAGAEDEDGGEPAIDPRYLPAQEALEAGDNDRAIAEYEKLLAANPADAEAATGRARAQLLRRTATADLQAARAAAAERADDVDAQILVADLDVLGGHVDDAFARLVEVVRRAAGDDKERVRRHLVELFGVVGNADPRVARARQQLASALF
ncbi:tetratricopeptide repeat protein [Nocardioides sp. ChNu-99]|uniref:co-chaperone YbbN n=1 Tax=Nocardioides sp. ChNu-99 TaxID=2839897 RepID=UPI0024065732|nr:tetratricopeptide repeat protein [Nocardioides sp. ChNu-99]MDF9715570.1 tetratricopeptide repeat protein [Nocardioides sp. ChNu-99]